MRSNNILATRIAAFVVASMSLLATAATAGAQAAATAEVCDADEGKPREVVNAFVALNRAMSDTTPEGRLSATRNAIKEASVNVERGVNMPGRAYITAKAMLLMLHIPNFKAVTTRGELGYQTNLNQEVDVVRAVDSLYMLVEKAHPKCAEEIQQWRFSQPFIDILTAATNALASDSLEKATELAKRAQILERTTPYSWQILASIATRQSNKENALMYWQKTYDLAGSDTTMREVKMQALYFLGETHLTEATSKQGAEAAAAAREAAKYFQQFITQGAGHKDTPAARSNLAQAYQLSGDGAKVAELWADLIANPGKYTTQDFLNSGVTASGTKAYEDAAKLFEHALAKEPYNRDALFNLSVSFYDLKQYAKMTPILTRLVDIDPNNPDVWEMYVFAHNQAGVEEKDAAKKKAYNDSVTKYSDTYEKMKSAHRVEYSVWQREPQAATLTGRIFNLGTTDKTYTLEFDFLAKDGSVVGSGKSATVTVAGGKSATYEVKVTAPDVVAFRGKLLPLPN